MKIYLEIILLESDKEFKSFDIDENSSLLELKKLLPFEKESQLWYLNSNKLSNNFTNWNSYDVYKVYVTEKWIDIFLQFNGQLYKVNMLKESYDIYHLKLRIFEKVKIIPPNIVLTFNQKILLDNETLGSLNIKNNDVIKVVLNLKSGH